MPTDEHTSHHILQAKQEQPVPASCYDFGTYVAYILYPPLFIAGPICSFKSFASQLRVPKQLNLLKVCTVLLA